MALNFPGPYEVRIKYRVGATGRDHVAKLNCNITTDPPVGHPFNLILVEQNDTTTIALNAAVDALLTLWAPFFRNTDSFGPVELWKNVPNSFEATYVSTYAPTVTVGTAGAGSVTAGQVIITFRTFEGGTAKVVLMETTKPSAIKQGFPFADAQADALADYLVGNDGWVIGRDTARFAAGSGFFPGINEKLYKESFR